MPAINYLAMGCANISAKEVAEELEQGVSPPETTPKNQKAWPKIRCTKSRPQLFVIAEEEPKHEESAANSKIVASPRFQALLASSSARALSFSSAAAISN